MSQRIRNRKQTPYLLIFECGLGSVVAKKYTGKHIKTCKSCYFYLIVVLFIAALFRMKNF